MTTIESIADRTFSHIRNNCPKLVEAIMARASYAKEFSELRVRIYDLEPLSNKPRYRYEIELDFGVFGLTVGKFNRRVHNSSNGSYSDTVRIWCEIGFKYPHLLDSYGEMGKYRNYITRSSRTRTVEYNEAEYDFDNMIKVIDKNAKSLVKVIEDDAPAMKAQTFVNLTHRAQFTDEMCYGWNYSVPLAFMQELKGKFPNIPEVDLDAIRSILTKNSALSPTTKV